ncbi:restriction endonuclease subunit S [Listeria monocytogenes]|nr:restriction endonuclease subunit S [Listeria monocytogenes]MDC39480.1 restriction endonuclease subunit S [Listeria monocytogenes]
MRNLEKSVPVIRFKGFSEAWEQRKLGDLVVDYVEKTSVQNQFPMLTSSQQKGIVLQEGYFANRQVTTENNIGYFVLPRGYFTFRSRSDNDVFVFNRNDIIDRGIISYFYPVFTLKSADSDFFLRRINNGIQRQLSIQAEGTGQHVLSLKKFKNIVAMFPSEGEQKKIGSFFKQLDDSIALHQRKLDALKQMKKGFLQQMFPKSEEDVPKIRFTDFNGNWRQRKLEEVADRVRGNDRRMELPTLTISASKGWLNQHERFFGNIAGKEQKNYTLLKKGQLSYNHGNSKSAKYGAVFVLRTYDEALVPRIYHSFKTNILANSDFIEYLFATKIPDRELRKIVSSGARMDGLLNINFNNFMSILIMLPFVEEQIKISNFLIRLDKIISLYQNKLDQLIKLKKAYLQYLFI